MPENIFPRKAGCKFGFVGGGGLVDDKNNLCILAPNALSEKIFAFLWFWMIFLAGLHIFHIFINMSLVLHSRHIRRSFLITAVMDRRLKSSLKENALDHMLKKMNFGQILFLYFFGRNVEYNVYRCVLKKLAEIETPNYETQQTLRFPTKNSKQKLPLENANNQVYPNVPNQEELDMGAWVGGWNFPRQRWTTASSNLEQNEKHEKTTKV